MTVLDDLGQYYQEQGVGMQGTDLFLASLPAVTTDPVVTLYITGGEPPEYLIDNEQPAMRTTHVQVEVRSTDYQAAVTRSEAFWALSSLANVVLGSTRYLRIQPLQEPFPIGLDRENRHQVAFNVRAKRAV